jgi:uncharacterized membrane protein YraQ (UPF0718 family)
MNTASITDYIHSSEFDMVDTYYAKKSVPFIEKSWNIAKRVFPYIIAGAVVAGAGKITYDLMYAKYDLSYMVDVPSHQPSTYQVSEKDF